MGGFSVPKYNQLLSIVDAHTRFENQLVAASITRTQLFAELLPLFWDGQKVRRYSPCLIHHHFHLEEGERMVSYGDRSKPSKDSSANIVPECWLSTGEEIEHRFIDDPSSIPPPPSSDFFSKFKVIVDKHSIDILGVCYAPEINKLPPGYVYLETLLPANREQVIGVFEESSLVPGTTVEASWILDGCGGRSCLVCASSGCHHCFPSYTSLKNDDSTV